MRVGLKCTPRLYGARAGVWAQGGCWRVRTVRGGEDGFQGCMACLRSACGCTARHTRGVQGLKAVRRGPSHRKRSRGGDAVDDPSTAAPVAAYSLVDLKVDEQNVKTGGARR